MKKIGIKVQVSVCPGSVVDFDTLLEVVEHELVTQSDAVGEYRFMIRWK